MFSLIEIGNKAFISRQGPVNFGIKFVPCDNIIIKNGILGRSSMEWLINVVTQNIAIKYFDICGNQLYGFKNIKIIDVENWSIS